MFEDYKLWCKQNNLKEGRYESLRQYLDNMRLSEDLAQAFAVVRLKKDKVRSAVFTYELLYAIEYIAAAVKEEGRKETGPGYPDYMLEKLTQAKRYLDAAINYYNAYKSRV